MANDINLFTRKLAEPFLKSFETERVLSKNVNTQLLAGKFGPEAGDNVDFKRAVDYSTVRTPKGDVSSNQPSPIITGKATGTVQEYFTSFVDYDEADEAIKMGNVAELLAPMATRMVTDLELDFGRFMAKNTALLAGTVGTGVTEWDHVAYAGAMMQSSGVPMDEKWCYAANPFTQTALSSNQRSLGGETGTMDANRNATITDNFAGMRVMTCTTLPTFQTGAGADRTGEVVGTPVATYEAAKDTMTQVVGVTGFQPNLVVSAGETVRFSVITRLNLSTRQPIIDSAGNQVVFTATVNEAVTLDGSGAGNLVITGPAINAANGAYNTVSSAIAAGDVVELGGAENTIIQPNLFWHKQAFSIGSVPIKKLHSTDTVATTKDGLQFRISKGSSFLENEQKVRIDFRPAYAALNPFFAGQGYGS